MIKLNHPNNMKTVILTSCMLALPSLGFADEQGEYLADLLLEKKSELSEEYITPNTRMTARTKEGSKAIMGEWHLSYNYNGAHNDKIVLDTTETSSKGTVFAAGKYYPNQGGAGSRIVCFDFSISTYSCLSEENSTLVAFKFKLQGNSLNSGFFGSGSTAEIAFDSADSNQYPLTGNRGGGSTNPGGAGQCADPFSTTCNTTGGNAEQPIYNDAQQQIEIPVLNYNGKKYRLILKNEGNSIFKLIEATKL